MNEITFRNRFTIVAACFIAVGLTGSAYSLELLVDGGFEDPSSTDWYNVYGTVDPQTANDTTMPYAGLEHATITSTTRSTGGSGGHMAQFVSAGFGAAAGITDFRGKMLELESYHNLVAMTAPAHGVYMQMYLVYYSGNSFLGFENPPAAYPLYNSPTPGYVQHAYSAIVPNFASPVDGIAFTLSTVDYVSSATGYFDNASLNLVPEPNSGLLLGAATCLAAFRRGKVA